MFAGRNTYLEQHLHDIQKAHTHFNEVYEEHQQDYQQLQEKLHQCEKDQIKDQTEQHYFKEKARQQQEQLAENHQIMADYRACIRQLEERIVIFEKKEENTV